MSNFIDPTFLQRLTHVMLTGAWGLTRLKNRILRVFPEDERLLSIIVESVWHEFSAARPNAKLLATYLRLAITAIPHEAESRSIRLRRDPMRLRWPVTKLATSEQLAAWLDISLNHLEWLADLKNWTTAQSETKLRHYTLIRLPRKRGKSRILEVPKPRLKAIQRRILHEILDLIPPHEAAHGFRRARSIVSYVSPHVGQRIVLHFDLRDFFASVTAAKVRAIFRTAGYPDATANLLAGLCTRTCRTISPCLARLRRCG